MTTGRRLAAVTAAIAVAVGLAALSQVPTSYAGPGAALLRLSWRTEAVRVEECRARTEEELEALAPHMRTPQVCTGTSVAFELRVAVDGIETVRDTLRGGGARGDQPVYLHRDLEITPGRHDLDVSFRPLLPETAQAVVADAALTYREPIEVAEHDVVLIAPDPATGRLVPIRP